MSNRELRVGSGTDIHAFERGRRLMLAGVHIPCEFGLSGHSDADVLLHAVADALLGAVGGGDIGMHFPDSDPRWQGCDSRVILAQVWAMVKAEGWRLVNLDCTLLAEMPKIAPHRDAMRCSLAALLDAPVERCSIKATTAETLGFVGRREGMLASAVVLIERER